MTTTSSTSSSNTISDFVNSLNSSSSSSSKSTSATSASDQQDRFLKLLTTQLKNQDPLNPLDNAQMTSQLAQISTVDGITKLNTTLQSLMANSNTEQALQAANLVGHSALVSGNALELGTNGGVAGFDLASAADTVKVEVKDANGNVVRTIEFKSQTAGTHNFLWDGKDDSGTSLATGSYTFAVTAKQGTNDITTTALKLGTISGVVRNSDGTIGIDVGTYGRFTLSDLKQII